MGERFWLAPEADSAMTYDPDNNPVEQVNVVDDLTSVSIGQKPGYAGLSKSIMIKAHDEDGLWISRQLVNCGDERVEVGLWGLSGMAKNGTAIIPRPKFQYHPAFVPRGTQPDQIGGFLSAQNMVLWPYTNLQDPRLTLGQKYILLSQYPHVARCNVNKFGLSDVYWVAYLVKTQAGARLFIKRIYFDPKSQNKHPDRGVVFEAFVCNQFLELEELGPMEELGPGQEATSLVDRWSVHKIARMPRALSDDWINDNVVPLVGFTREPSVA